MVLDDEEDKPKDKFDLLYKVDTERKRQREQKTKELLLAKELDELRQCTF